jgi:hypothetical protein
MSKTIHSITLGDETFTRESASRKYGACLVATITEESQRVENARAARTAEQATKLEAELAAMLAERGTTLEKAQAEYDARHVASDATHEKVLDYIGAHREDDGMYQAPEYLALRATHRAAHDFMFAKSGPFGVLELAEQAKRERAASVAHCLPIGGQGVVSWHHTVALAEKAAAHEAAVNARCARYRAFSVRTDFTTRERAVRKAKVA